MTDRDLERFLLRIALPPVRLGLYVKRLKARSAEPAARTVAINELRRAARIRKRRRLVELGVRAWAVAADVLLASLGFIVFIWGDLTTHRGGRVGGIVLVTLAFVAGAIISTVRDRAR